VREETLALLAGWHSSTSQQASLRDLFSDCIRNDPNWWSREGRPDHLTASAVVLDPDAQRVLLGLHRKVRLWLQFGGHLEPQDESMPHAALREAREESGVDALLLTSDVPLRLDRHAAPCGARYHLDVQFLAVAPPAAKPQASEESIDVRWFAIDDLPTSTDNSVARLVDDAVMALRSRA
jgi:8-oxo-dGTP pyrophosphatase MutT (NUDIX family)